ncbi:MAG: CDP-alcohol phosphatidyltransferase family protein [Bacteroidales bacterium]
MKKYIPNVVTLINLFLGCLAVVMAFQEQLVLAAIFVVIGSLLDFVDGFLARILKAGSVLGEQLDSLADLISFGMAPAAIMYQYMAGAAQINGNQVLALIPYLAFLITVFSGLRLAIFNVDTRQRTFFVGLPTPANALFLVSFPLVMAFPGWQTIISQMVETLTTNLWMMLALVLLFSWLLVSPIRMFSLKFTSLKWPGNQVRFVFLAGSLLLFLIFQISSIPLVLIFYIILSVIQHFAMQRS